MSLVKEFKTFISRGNVIDLAVAVVIGGAFSAIVKSFVADVVMPIIGLLFGKPDFNDITLADGAIKIGSFITSIVMFLLVAFAIFMVVKAMNSMKKKEEEAPAAPPAPTKEETLLGEIRDLLKQQN